MFGQFPAHQQSTYFNQYGNDGDFYDMDEEGTIPLEEDIDSNYDPQEEEIIEYAEYLGMDPRVDGEFFYIAKEGLKASLPQPWRAMRNSKGEIFYVNEATRQTTFVHPCDEFYKNEFVKAKQRQQQKKNNNLNNNQQSRNKSSDINNNNNQNFTTQKFHTQLGSLKPKGVLSNLNNNSFSTEKKNNQTNLNNFQNGSHFNGSASKNISQTNQVYQSNNKQYSVNNDSFYNIDTSQSKFQNNESTTMNKSDMKKQQSAFKGQNQAINEVFIFDEQNGYDIPSNIKSRTTSIKKNSDQMQQLYDEGPFDGQNQMRTSLNSNTENTDGKKAPLYSQESDVMNDEMIEDEILFFENYMKKQYQNLVEENEKEIVKTEKEYQQKFDLDQLKLKNKRDEIEDEKNRKIKGNQKKCEQMKEKIRKEKYNELISEMEKHIKQIKTQHEQNIENINKRQKDDQVFMIEQYNEDKENQYKYKIEESKRKRQEREQYIKNNKDKIEVAKIKLKQKFQEIEIELQIQEVQKLEQTEDDLKLELIEQQKQYVKELQEEENRIYKLINTDEKQIQKEIFQKKIQMKDLYQRKYDYKKSEELNKINDKIRQFYQEEQIMLDERIKKEEQEFINNLIKLKMKEPQIKHQGEINDLTKKHKQDYQDIKDHYTQKMKNDEIIGQKRINDLRNDLEKQNQTIINKQNFNSKISQSDQSATGVQQQKILEELLQNINLKKQDLKLVKQQQKQMKVEINNNQLMKEIFQSERKEDYLKQKSAEKQDMMDSYAKMLSYTQTKQINFTQNYLNSNSQNKSTNKRINFNLQQKNLQHNYNSHMSQPQCEDNNIEDEDQPLSTFLHQNLQQIVHMKQNNNDTQKNIQNNENDQNRPQQSNRVVFPDDDSDDDLHDSFTQEKQREIYLNDYENIRNQMHKVPQNRRDINQDSEQNNFQRQDTRCHQSRNGNKQIFIENQQINNEVNIQSNMNLETVNSNQQDVQDPLVQFLDEEWLQIDNLKEELRFDKIIIKKSYEYLKYEKNKISKQIQIIEQNLPLHQENQQKINTIKSKLQQLADRFNEDVKITRENQKNLQIREEILYQIEDMLQQGNFTQQQLSEYIDNYQKSIVDYIYPLLNQKLKQKFFKDNTSPQEPSSLSLLMRIIFKYWNKIIN